MIIIKKELTNDATVPAFQSGGWTSDSAIVTVLSSCICTDWWERRAGAAGRGRGSAACQGGAGTYSLGDC